MRLMQMERELEYVRSDRDRNQLYLTRILREVDQKVGGSIFFTTMADVVAVGRC